MALTDLKIKSARPASKPYHLTDGHGFFLVIQPNGSKLWRWKYRFEGKFRLMALGSYPEVSLASGRAAHAKARTKLLKGIDPMTERKAEKNAAPVEAAQSTEVPVRQSASAGEGVNSFRKVAAQWFEKWKVGKVQRYAQNTEARLAEYAIGHVVRLVGDALLVDIDESTILKYQTDRLKESAAPKSINEEVRFLLTMMGESGDVIRVRLRKKKKLKLPARRKIGKAYEPEETQQMGQLSRKSRSPHIHLALTMALNAGMHVHTSSGSSATAV